MQKYRTIFLPEMFTFDEAYDNFVILQYFPKEEIFVSARLPSDYSF